MNTTLFYKTVVTLLITNIMFFMNAIGKEGLKIPYVVFLTLLTSMLMIYVWFPIPRFFKKEGEK